jgi:hypothetical protein
MTYDGRLDFFPITGKRAKNFPYEHLKPICDSNYRRPYLDSGPNYIVQFDRDWLNYSSSNPGRDFLQKGSDYFKNIPLLQNVEAQIKKCDVAPKAPDNPVFKRTMELMHSYFKILKSEIKYDPEAQFTLGTSGGIPYNKSGLRDKRAILASDLNNWMKYTFDMNYRDIGCYNDKDELLSMEELSRGKSRGIFGSSFHGIFREMMVYGEQNKIILQNHEESWIKYGFVKQYGGYNKLMKTLERFSFRWEGDFSGFDRKVWLKYVYELRNANLINAHEYKELVERVTKDNVNPLVLLPNGYVVERQTGNSSGKLDTTCDNSIAHMIIKMYLFVKRFHQIGYALDEITLSLIFNNVVLALYSDDSIGSFDLDTFEFETPEVFLDYEREVYSEFGLEMKRSAQFYSIDKTLGRLDPKHSFLGSSAGFDEHINAYVPVPRWGKICSSFTQKYSGRDKVQRFIRYVVLTLNCVPDTEYYDNAMHFLNWYYNHPDNRAFVYMFDEILHELDLDACVKATFSKQYMGFE